jgi:hypothetical protein
MTITAPRSDSWSYVRKEEEGRRKKEEGRRKKEVVRRKKKE